VIQGADSVAVQGGRSDAVSMADMSNS
jgi:hypothetical protein